MAENIVFSKKGVTESERLLHTPGLYAKSNLIYVQEVGKLRSLQPHICKREKIDSFLFLLVLSGEGKIRTAGTEYTIKKGDAALLDCYSGYEHVSSQDKPWQLVWVHFFGNNSNEYYKLFIEKNNGNVIFKTEEINQYIALMNALLELQEQKDLMSELKSAVILTDLCTRCIEAVSGICTLEDAREYINKHYKEQDVIKKLVDLYGKNETELNDEFYKNFGIEIREYVLIRKFNASKELLRFTIMPIQEVVMESGILNIELLRELFKKNEKMTPEEYRSKWAQWIKN